MENITNTRLMLLQFLWHATCQDTEWPEALFEVGGILSIHYDPPMNPTTGRREGMVLTSFTIMPVEEAV